MALLAVRKVELCEPISALSGLEDYEGVRVYCYIHGTCISRFDIWHGGHPIDRERLIHEIGVQMWEELARRVFSLSRDSSRSYWSHITQMVTDNLELALEADDAVLALTRPASPAPVPPLMASITIPTRDRPEDLALCLKNLTQHVTEVNHEIIIVDNNPASGLTEPVVRQFPGVVYIPEPRAGVTYARNAGALHAQGDIIVCTDDDVLVEEGWLDNLIRPFTDPTITAVTGMVIPFELDHLAQMDFEVYGGLTRTFEPTRYNAHSFNWLHSEVYKIGVTANCAIRASVFANPAMGPFDNELEIAEDLYMFYRILKAGGICYYEPTATVRHKHRSTRKGLRRQIYNYGRSYTSMELRMYYVDGDKGALNGIRAIFKHQKQRIRDTLAGRSALPLDLILVETWGHIVGPLTLLKTIRQARRKGVYTAKMFQAMQTVRNKEKQKAHEVEARPKPVLRRAQANPDYTQYIILSHARTGSNLLQFLLDAHKNVFMVHEIFNHREEVRKVLANIPRIVQLDDDPIEYIESYVYNDHKKHIKAAGFKLLYYQARNEEWKEVWDYLRSPHIKVIHLKRRNLLDRYLSFKLAMRSDVWVAFKNNAKNGASKDKSPIILEPRECFNDFRSSLKQQEKMDEFFKDQPRLDVVYEELRANVADESRRVQEFLGLNIQDLTPQTKKLQTKKKSEVIANYEELKSELIRALSTGEQWAREEWLEFFDD